ncbi:cell division protein FtsL [Marinobacter halodurans]|uniref:Cell division protein FtsL n=1 Tax=Marinobacter halodurans TaxID=2528979 RepID=A0ABY1ZKW9_9GAMM|nr:cell division protein FtsL [Marinobacter halodurans]TBW56260.1 cell division protein FtsL [Marinobacter halodurans]
MAAVTIERPQVQTRKRLHPDTMKAGVNTAMRLSRRIFAGLCQRHVLISAGLASVLVFSAIGVVYSAHENRVLFNDLAQLQAQRDGYQREWSQLLLEQSALSAHSRVEARASQGMNMVVPGKQDIVLVQAQP